MNVSVDSSTVHRRLIIPILITWIILLFHLRRQVIFPQQQSYLFPHQVLQVIPIVVVIYQRPEHHHHRCLSSCVCFLHFCLCIELFLLGFFSSFSCQIFLRLYAIYKKKKPPNKSVYRTYASTPMISVLFSHHFLLIGKKYPSIDITDGCCYYYYFFFSSSINISFAVFFSSLSLSLCFFLYVVIVFFAVFSFKNLRRFLSSTN